MNGKRPAKGRLDQVIVGRGLASAEQAHALIMAGDVFVNGTRVDKAGTLIAADAQIELKQKAPYASRGGLKLEAALSHFPVSVADKVCADVGCSTGGFTDVLLQSGAARVYAIDTAAGEIAWKLRNDPRVVLLERTNACYLEALPEPISVAVIDVSLVPLKNVLPAVLRWLQPEGDIVALLKPHYEARREQLPEGAVIRDAATHRAILSEFEEWAKGAGLIIEGTLPSPIVGGGGNAEFLLWIRTKPRQ